MLTQHRLQEILDYNADTGVFVWKKLPYNMAGLTGTRAGSMYASGYVYIQIAGRAYRTGRLAWLYVHGVWPPAYVDHKNGDRGDNRLENLRLATNQQNQANRGAPGNNTSGTKGVRFEASRGKWRASICINNKTKNLGRYSTREEAMEAYATAARAAWGEFAKIGSAISAQAA